MIFFLNKYLVHFGRCELLETVVDELVIQWWSSKGFYTWDILNIISNAPSLHLYVGSALHNISIERKWNKVKANWLPII